MLSSSSPERRGRKAGKAATDCGFCHVCQLPIHCCRKLIKRVFHGAHTEPPNQSPGGSRGRGRVQCHAIKPALWQKKKKKLIKNSYGWLLQSEAEHLCSSRTQRDLFISKHVTSGRGTVCSTQRPLTLSCLCVLADAKKQKKEGKKRERAQMDWWGCLSRRGRKKRVERRSLPCSNTVPLHVSCRLAVGAYRALTKPVEIWLLVTICFAFFFFLAPDKKQLVCRDRRFNTQR